jgi:hypothetical protein
MPHSAETVMRMKLKNKTGFTLIEVLLLFSVILIVASFAIRVLYGNELRAFERGIFQKIGIGEVAQFLILAVCGIAALYFKILPDLREAKRRNLPIVSRPIKCLILILVVLILGLIFYRA